MTDWRGLYDDWYARTEAEFARLGHPHGFNPPVLCSVEAFDATPRLLVATLNPAGDRDYPEHRGLRRYETGNAYLTVDWNGLGAGQAPLQLQIAAVFEHLRKRSNFNESLAEFARVRVVTAQAVPFRSRDEASLHRREESLDIAACMWRDIFKHWRPQAMVAIARSTADAFGRALGHVRNEGALPSGWGNYTIGLHQFDGGRILVLPHLSRFKLFGRPQSEPHLAQAFDWLMDAA